MATSKQKRKYAECCGYLSWIEMVHDQKLTTLEIHRLEAMIEKESNV
ncbi:hypothetical protein [Weissella jogaejeotgali]|nr:hypothetical protein [Weissella jogaejeotgali]